MGGSVQGIKAGIKKVKHNTNNFGLNLLDEGHLSILGTTGTGKTTLLKKLLKQLKPKTEVFYLAHGKGSDELDALAGELSAKSVVRNKNAFRSMISEAHKSFSKRFKEPWGVKNSKRIIIAIDEFREFEDIIKEDKSVYKMFRRIFEHGHRLKVSVILCVQKNEHINFPLFKEWINQSVVFNTTRAEAEAFSLRFEEISDLKQGEFLIYKKRTEGKGMGGLVSKLLHDGHGISEIARELGLTEQYIKKVANSIKKTSNLNVRG